MGSITAQAAPFTPLKTKGHIRSASDPAPSTSASPTSYFNSDPSEDGIDDPTDSVIASSDCEAPIKASPKSSAMDPPISTTLDFHFPTYASPFKATPALRAIGPRAVAYGMPNMKISHEKLRAAQYVFPPEMCLFVGNLPASWDDGMLTRAVKYEFGQFGPCTVGVFRKVATKPYAIVQYTDMYDASHAMFYGNGLWMERPLRVELSSRARF